MPETYTLLAVVENVLLAGALSARLFKAISNRTTIAILTLVATIAAVRQVSEGSWIAGTLAWLATGVLAWAWVTEPRRRARHRRAS